MLDTVEPASGDRSQTETSSQFQKGCAIKFQARPLSERPPEFHAKFELELETDTIELCATRCYQDGCTGAKFDPETKSCSLSYNDKHFCNNSKAVLSYKATEPTWIHCVNCWPQLMNETSIIEGTGVSSSWNKVGTSTVLSSDISSGSIPPSSKFHDANKDFQDLLKAGCIVRFQIVKLEERPSQLTSNFETPFKTEAAEKCALHCYQNGCTGAKFEPETSECSLSFDATPYCSDSKFATISRTKQPVFMHCLTCVPYNASANQHFDDFSLANIDATPMQEEKGRHDLSTLQTVTTREESGEIPEVEEKTPLPAEEASGEEMVDGNILPKVQASMDETTALGGTQVPSESLLTNSPAGSSEEVTTMLLLSELPLWHSTMIEESATISGKENSGENPENEEETSSPAEEASGEEPLGNTILPEVQANMDETTTFGEIQTPSESVTTDLRAISSKELTSALSEPESTIERLTTTEESSKSQEFGENPPPPKVEDSGQEPAESSLLPLVQANKDEITKLGETQKATKYAATGFRSTTIEGLPTTPSRNEFPVEHSKTTDKSTVIPVKENDGEISASTEGISSSTVETSEEEPVNINFSPKVEANMDETTTLGENQLPPESLTTGVRIITSEELTTAASPTESTTEHSRTTEELLVIPVKEDSGELLTSTEKISSSEVYTTEEKPVNVNIFPKVQTATLGESQVPPESMTTGVRLITNEQLAAATSPTDSTLENSRTTGELPVIPVKEDSGELSTSTEKISPSEVYISEEKPVNVNIFPKVQTETSGENQLPPESMTTGVQIITSEELTAATSPTESTFEHSRTTEESPVIPVKEDSGELLTSTEKISSSEVYTTEEKPVNVNIFPKVQTATLGESQVPPESMTTGVRLITNEQLAAATSPTDSTLENSRTTGELPVIPVKEDSGELSTSTEKISPSEVYISEEKPVNVNIFPKVQTETSGENQLPPESMTTGVQIITSEELTAATSPTESTFEHSRTTEESPVIPVKEDSGELLTSTEKISSSEVYTTEEKPVNVNIFPKVQTATSGENQPPPESMTTGVQIITSEELTTATSPTESTSEHSRTTEDLPVIPVKEDSGELSTSTHKISSSEVDTSEKKPVNINVFPEVKANMDETATLGESQVSSDLTTTGYRLLPSEVLTTATSPTESTFEHSTTTEEAAVIPVKGDSGEFLTSTQKISSSEVYTNEEKPVNVNIFPKVQTATSGENQLPPESLTTGVRIITSEELTTAASPTESTSEHSRTTEESLVIPVKEDSEELSTSTQKISSSEVYTNEEKPVNVNIFPKAQTATLGESQVPPESMTTGVRLITSEELTVATSPTESTFEHSRTTEESPVIPVKEDSGELSTSTRKISSLEVNTSEKKPVNINIFPEVQANMDETTTLGENEVSPRSMTTGVQVITSEELTVATSHTESTFEHSRTTEESPVIPVKEDSGELSTSTQKISSLEVDTSEKKPVNINIFPEVQANMDETTTLGENEVSPRSMTTRVQVTPGGELTIAASATESTFEQSRATEESPLVPVKEISEELLTSTQKTSSSEVDTSEERPVNINIFPKVQANADEAATSAANQVPSDAATTGYRGISSEELITTSTRPEPTYERFMAAEELSTTTTKDDSRASEAEQKLLLPVTSSADEASVKKHEYITILPEVLANVDETTTSGKIQVSSISVTTDYRAIPSEKLEITFSRPESASERFTTTEESSSTTMKEDSGKISKPEHEAASFTVGISGNEPVIIMIPPKVQAETTISGKFHVSLESVTTDSPATPSEELATVSLHPESTMKHFVEKEELSSSPVKEDSGEIPGHEEKSLPSVTSTTGEMGKKAHVDINVPIVEAKLDETTTLPVTHLLSLSMITGSPIVFNGELSTASARPQTFEFSRTTEEFSTISVKENSREIAEPVDITYLSASLPRVEAHGEESMDSSSLSKMEAKMEETTELATTQALPESTINASSLLDSPNKPIASYSSSFSSFADGELITTLASTVPSVTETIGKDRESGEKTLSPTASSEVEANESKPVGIMNVKSGEEIKILSPTQIPSKSMVGISSVSTSHDEMAATSSPFVDSTTQQFSMTLESSLFEGTEATGKILQPEEKTSSSITLLTIEKSKKEPVQSDKLTDIKATIEKETTEGLPQASSVLVARISANSNDGLELSSPSSFVFEPKESETALSTPMITRIKSLGKISGSEEKPVEVTTSPTEKETVEESIKVNKSWNVEAEPDDTNKAIQLGSHRDSVSLPPTLILDGATFMEETIVPTLPAAITSSSGEQSSVFDHGRISSVESHLDKSQASSETTDLQTAEEFDDITMSIINASIVHHEEKANLPINVGFVPGSEPDSPEGGEQEEEISKMDTTENFDYENTVSTETLQSKSTGYVGADDFVTTTEPPLQLVRDFIDALAGGSLDTIFGPSRKPLEAIEEKLGELKKYLRKPTELKQDVKDGHSKEMEQVDITDLNSFSTDDSNTIVPTHEGTTSACVGRLEFQNSANR
ncbi:hypothetical protein KIN20_020382 [Parelaphostrongylus tenuis]|uniref:Uncharacterized protein n=1 Tax=Parelaphostrongylus tenuis TaxID=148309 RepID=A0AAD5MMI5_PARTN|nr:hypothetical protein KIN20_020382 [Parelaphostrongylus tenuis]